MNVAILISFAAANLAVANTLNVIFPMNSAERVTSFSVVDKTVYVTYLDLHKTSGPNGAVKFFHLDGTAHNRELEVLDTGDVKIISPVVVRIDECHRLWILDSGVQNISGTQNKTILPSLYVYDFSKKFTEEVYQIPHKFVNTESFFSNLAIDIEKSCLNTYVYISDFNARKLLVYNVETNIGKIVKHHFFNPDPLSNIPINVLYNINKRTVNGLCGLAVVGDNLVFHALASKNDFIISRHTLKTKEEIIHDDSKLVLTRPSEAGVMQYDKKMAVVFYALFKKIGCLRVTESEQFNSHYYDELNIGVSEGFVTDIQVVGPLLYILVNNENNFEIETRVIRDLINNTTCDYKNKSNFLERNLAPKQYINNGVFMMFLFSVVIFN